MKVLHIITKRDELAEKIIEAQRAECAIDVEDLSGAIVDYAALLEKIFTVDSLQVW
jgi:hypothetical protein